MKMWLILTNFALFKPLTQGLQLQLGGRSVAYLSLFCAANQMLQSVSQYDSWLLRYMRKCLRICRNFLCTAAGRTTTTRTLFPGILSLFDAANQMLRSIFWYVRWLLRNR